MLAFSCRRDLANAVSGARRWPMSRAQRAAADSSGWNPAHDGQKSEHSERFWPSSRGFATSMDLKVKRQSLVRPHFALTKPGAVRLGPWMWARPLHDSTSLILLHVSLTAPR